MKRLKFGMSIFFLMLASPVIHADIVQGKILQEQSCTKCHDTSVYSRPDRRIKTLSALQEQVSRCTKPAGAEWSKQEVMDVVEYLNNSFYHYK